jgi:hypothetical protein
MHFNGVPFRHGDHVCALYSSPAEQRMMAARFIAQGLRAGERCLFAGYSEADLVGFRDALRHEQIDPDEAHARGALILLTKEEAHLLDGCFDSERMLGMLNGAVEDALNEGYHALRTCGDMTWLLDDAPGSQQVVEYEALVTSLFQNVRAIAMCQYDRTRLPSALLDHGLGTHPTVLMDGHHLDNPFQAAASALPPHDVRSGDVQWKLQELAQRAK